MCYHTHSSPNESIDCVVRCTIYRFIWRGMCVITKSFLIGFQRIDSQSLPYVNKIYRFMWRKGQLLQILSTHSAQHKIYRFIWRKWRFFFQVAKYGFFMAIFWPSNWPFCRNFWTRRCSFPQILWLSKKTCLRKWCEFYRFIWFHWNIQSDREFSQTIIKQFTISALIKVPNYHPRSVSDQVSAYF